METTQSFKIVTCPDCGADLKNAPHRDYSVCPSCASTKSFPRFTEPERTDAKRAALPVAKRLNCHDTWWTIAGQPGIWGAKFVATHPGVVRARFQAAGGIRTGWSVDYFGRLEKEEAELRTVLGVPAVEDHSEAANG
jgi:ribosomal protein S27AE